MKGFRPRDSTGSFITNSEKNKKAMQFMMNRKIKYFGTKPFDFVSIAEKSMLNKFESKLNVSLEKDIQDSFR